MAYHIQIRNGTASSWTSTNPILSSNEPGIETDTGRFKIGDGSTAWNSLGYSETQGGTQTIPYRSYGDGSDGNVTISSGTTTLTRDMFYNNLTLSGTGILNTAGYKIFIKSILDITAAQAGAIQWNGNNGSNASGATGGAAPATETSGSLGAIAEGGAGPTATTGNGTAGSAGTLTNTNGGVSGAGGSGGQGTSGGGGNGGAARTSSVDNPFSRFETSFLNGAALISGGPGGSGGGSGSGDATNTGGGGGSGGNGGGVVAIYANIIVKSSSTLAGTIQANGGVGGNGGNSSAGVTGGGGGGGGGSGGWVYLSYNYVFGPRIAGLIQANGGNGGQGGSGTDTGNVGNGGTGGNAGSGGRINMFSVPLGLSTNVIGTANTSLKPELVGFSPVSNSLSISLPGGNGGFNGTATASL